jgi:hypothetical protein
VLVTQGLELILGFSALGYAVWFLFFHPDQGYQWLIGSIGQFELSFLIALYLFFARGMKRWAPKSQAYFTSEFPIALGRKMMFLTVTAYGVIILLANIKYMHALNEELFEAGLRITGSMANHAAVIAPWMGCEIFKGRSWKTSFGHACALIVFSLAVITVPGIYLAREMLLGDLFPNEMTAYLVFSGVNVLLFCLILLPLNFKKPLS